jgi:hypothetical protein
MIMAKLTMQIVAFGPHMAVCHCTYSDKLIGVLSAKRVRMIKCGNVHVDADVVFEWDSKPPTVVLASRGDIIDGITGCIKGTFPSPQDPQEGDRVLVRQSEGVDWKERIYTCELNYSRILRPFVCVEYDMQDMWLAGEKVETTQWKHMKPLDLVKVTDADDVVTWEW